MTATELEDMTHLRLLATSFPSRARIAVATGVAQVVEGIAEVFIKKGNAFGFPFVDFSSENDFVHFLFERYFVLDEDEMSHFVQIQ